MKKPSSEIGIGRIPGEAEAEVTWLSPRMIFPYLKGDTYLRSHPPNLYYGVYVIKINPI